MADLTELQLLQQKLLHGPLDDSEIAQLRADLILQKPLPNDVQQAGTIALTPTKQAQLAREKKLISKHTQATQGASLTDDEISHITKMLIDEIAKGTIKPPKAFLDSLLDTSDNENLNTNLIKKINAKKKSIEEKLEEEAELLKDAWFAAQQRIDGSDLAIAVAQKRQERQQQFIIQQLLETKLSIARDDYPELTKKVLHATENIEQEDAAQRKARLKILADTIDAWRAAHIARLGLSRALREHSAIYGFDEAMLIDSPWYEKDGGDKSSWHPDLEATLYIASMMYVPIAIAALFLDPKTQYERDKRNFIFFDAVAWSLINLIRFGNNETAVSFCKILTLTAVQSTFILLGGYLFDLFNQWYFDCKNLWDQQDYRKSVGLHTDYLTRLSGQLEQTDQTITPADKISLILNDAPLSKDDRVVDESIKAITAALNERKAAVKKRILYHLLAKLEHSGTQIELDDAKIIQALAGYTVDNLTAIRGDIDEYQQLVELEIANYQKSQEDLTEKIDIFYKRSLLWNIAYAFGLSTGASLEILFIVGLAATGPLGFAVIAAFTAFNQAKNAWYERKDFIKLKEKYDSNLEFLNNAGENGFQAKALAAAAGNQQQFNLELVNRGMKPIDFNKLLVDGIIRRYLAANSYNAAKIYGESLKAQAQEAANDPGKQREFNRMLAEMDMKPMNFNTNEIHAPAGIIDLYIKDEKETLSKRLTAAENKMYSNRYWYAFVVISMILLVASPGHLLGLALFIVCLTTYAAYKSYNYFSPEKSLKERWIEMGIINTSASGSLVLSSVSANSSTASSTANLNNSSNNSNNDYRGKGGTFSPRLNHVPKNDVTYN
ncbi:MAG TPA: hypothetical protein VI522_00115 [Gammaproteobacteria bacterium]|nr:hypothetical protein [Gammaproteobacteria bacterium]